MIDPQKIVSLDKIESGFCPNSYTYNDTQIRIFFGNKENSIESSQLLLLSNLANSPKTNLLDNLAQKLDSLKLDSLNLTNTVFLKQKHSVLGSYVDYDNLEALRTCPIEGDYLITDKPNINLAIYTADCLPIILHDTYNNAVGLAHAGRVGSVNLIALEVLKAMSVKFGTKTKDLKIFLGPSAKACCYEIGQDLAQEIKDIIIQKIFKNKLLYKSSANSANKANSYNKANIDDKVNSDNTRENRFANKNNKTVDKIIDRVILKRDAKYFLDLPELNSLILKEIAGVSDSAINLNYNACTICNKNFCSYRRSNGKPERQLTIVSINKA